ncbi:MAG: acetylxylan esterase [Verrucomicrobia bacterium]|nr:acetylxylan esterase [Verrucomicrobiota bacterium]
MKTPLHRLMLTVFFAAWSSSAVAQESPAQRHAMATNQLLQVAVAISARCLAEVRTLEDWQKQRPELRRQLRDMLGLDPLPPRTALKPQITGTLDRPAYRIEKVVFQSLPGLYVTGNFYVPKAAATPVPAILYLCGHSPGPLGAKVHYQDRAQWFAAHGYAVLILDTLEFGEVAGIHHGTHNLNMWHWLSLGYTPAGVEVWNAMRALDYLETRSEVDMRRVGLTGISGGGAMTWYTAALDDRIAAAAPVCSTWTAGSQATNWLARGQCDCIYYHNTYCWDFPIVGALIAPRPLMILSGQKDSIFPPDGYHEVFNRAKKVYDLYAKGNSDRIREVDDNVGHSDPPLFLREARQWMNRWLKNDLALIPDEANPPPKEKPEDLACLDRVPRDAVNFRVQNEFIPAAKIVKPASLAAWNKRRTELVAALRTKVFGWFPTQPVPFETKVLRTAASYASDYAHYKEVSFNSEAGVRIRAQLFTPKNGATDSPLLICVKRPADSLYPMDFDELLPVFRDHRVLVLNPRFTEQPLNAALFADIERTAAWCGRTIASMQVWDILRAIEWAVNDEKIPSRKIALYGKDDMAALSIYAAMFDARVTQVIVSDPPASHWQRPALLNVLRVTDLPEAAAALAPRRLVGIRSLPIAFDLTRAIYGVLGVKKNLATAASLPEALLLESE